MRNAEASRGRILEAAMAEFSSYGIAGARVDRIAKTAGCNKNLIYIYFESKETLFETVLQRSLAEGYEDVAFTPEDLGGYAGRVFDFTMAHPDFMRLMAWYALELRGKVQPGRSAAFERKLVQVNAAQAEGIVGDAFSANFLVTAIMAIAVADRKSVV